MLEKFYDFQMKIIENKNILQGYSGWVSMKFVFLFVSVDYSQLYQAQELETTWLNQDESANSCRRSSTNSKWKL